MTVTASFRSVGIGTANTNYYPISGTGGFTKTKFTQHLIVGGITGTDAAITCVMSDRPASELPRKLADVNHNAGADKFAIFNKYIHDDTSATSYGLDCTGNNGTGGASFVVEFAGQRGDAIRQTVTVSRGISANPVITFPQSTLAGNGVLVGYFSTVSGPLAAMVPAGFTQLVNSQYGTPVGGICVAWANNVGLQSYTYSGACGAGIAFGIEVEAENYRDPIGQCGVIY